MLEKLAYFLKRLVKKPFKIGIVTVNYLSEKKSDGVAIHTSHLSRELAKLGCEVHVFTQEEKSSTKIEYIKDGKLVIHKIKTKIEFPIKDPLMKKRMSYFIFENTIIQEISKEHSQDKFDVLHSHNVGAGGSFISKYFHDIPWVHTFHSLEKNRLKFLAKEERKYLDIVKWTESTIRYADALITVSEKLKLEVLQNYPVKENKIFPIHNGVDLEFFKSENTPQQDKKILYVGRFSLEKGIDILLKIIKKVLEENTETKFVVVTPLTKGVASSLKRTERGFEGLLEKYPQRFIWHREILDKKDIKKLYNECVLYIQPSRYDSFPTTVLEAMACGKAVVCSNKGGMPEMVENAGLITPLNSNLFSKNILRLLEDYRLRERYGRRGIERAKLFGWEDIALKTLTLYKKVTGKLKKGEDKYDITS